MHEPWFRHGLDAHSLMLVWQLGPGERAPAVGMPIPTGLWQDPLQDPRRRLGCSQSPALCPPRRQPVPMAGRRHHRSPQSPPPGSLTTEALPAGAHVAAGHVPAGATVGTRVGLTLIVVHITVGAAPPGVTVTLVPAQGTAGWFTRAHAPVSAATLRSDGTEGLVPSDTRSPLKGGNSTPSPETGVTLPLGQRLAQGSGQTTHHSATMWP